MKCSSCGKEIPNSVKFCKYCGAEAVPENISTEIVEEDISTENVGKQASLLCGNCGAEVSADMLFCRKCGKRTDFEVKAAEKMCKKCGKPLKSNAAFCIACGSPTGDGDISTDTHVEPSHTTEDKKKFKKNNALIAVLTVLIVLLVFTASAAAYIVFNPDSELAAFITGNDDNYSDDYDDRDDSDDRDDKDDRKDDLDSDEDFDDDSDFSLYDDEEDYDDYDDEYDEYDDYDDYYDDYLFPSDTEYITREHLDDLTRDEVALIRNEIYARHGYIFSSEPYKSYFNEKDWYYPNPSFSDSDFNSVEKANKDFIVKYESEKGWR